MLPRRCARDSSERYGLRNRPGRMLFVTGFVTVVTVFVTVVTRFVTGLVTGLVTGGAIVGVTGLVRPVSAPVAPPVTPVSAPVAPPVTPVSVPVTPPASCNASRNEMSFTSALSAAVLAAGAFFGTKLKSEARSDAPSFVIFSGAGTG